MSPTIVFDAKGTFKIATGSPGGPLIIPYTAQSIINLIDGHETPAKAAAEPHVSNLNSPTLIEKDTAAEALIPQLEAMGHHVAEPIVEQSGVNIIERVKGGYLGAADPRRDGDARGD
jgi:gamma-glutamyltranspeptidase/glutathione hydrolase